LLAVEAAALTAVGAAALVGICRDQCKSLLELFMP